MKWKKKVCFKFTCKTHEKEREKLFLVWSYMVEQRKDKSVETDSNTFLQWREYTNKEKKAACIIRTIIWY